MPVSVQVSFTFSVRSAAFMVNVFTPLCAAFHVASAVAFPVSRVQTNALAAYSDVMSDSPFSTFALTVVAVVSPVSRLPFVNWIFSVVKSYGALVDASAL